MGKYLSPDEFQNTNTAAIYPEFTIYKHCSDFQKEIDKELAKVRNSFSVSKDDLSKLEEKYTVDKLYKCYACEEMNPDASCLAAVGSNDYFYFCEPCTKKLIVMAREMRPDLKGHTDKETHTNWNPNDDDFAEDA